MGDKSDKKDKGPTVAELLEAAKAAAAEISHPHSGSTDRAVVALVKLVESLL